VKKEITVGQRKIDRVIGCIDETYVKLIKPPVAEHQYLNRKEYLRINAMIVSSVVSFA